MSFRNCAIVIDSRYYFRLIFILLLPYMLFTGGCATIGTSQEAEGPYIVSTYPSSGDFNISRYTDINIRFSEVMDPSAETGLEIVSKGIRVEGTKRWSDSNTLLVFRPDKPLDPNNMYQGIMREGRSMDGKPAVGIPYIWMFTTGN